MKWKLMVEKAPWKHLCVLLSRIHPLILLFQINTFCKILRIFSPIYFISNQEGRLGNRCAKWAICGYIASVVLFCRDSVFGIATGCRLDGMGIESRWGARFSLQVQTLLWGSPSLLYKGYQSFPRVKRLGRGVDHPLPSAVEERVGLYLCYPSGPSWPLLGWTLQYSCSPNLP
jgi:hypothetical protein